MAYNRTYWKNGQPPAIDAAKLNNIEQGIVDLNVDVASLGTIFTGSMANNWMNFRYKEFPQSTTWVAPDNILNNTITVLLEGGGGGGGGNFLLHDGYINRNYANSGGGGSGYITLKTIKIIPGQSYPIVIGAGGNGGGYGRLETDLTDPYVTDGENGGTTTAFGLSAAGGKGGKKPADLANGGDGGDGEAGGAGGSVECGYLGGLSSGPYIAGKGGNGNIFGGGGCGGNINMHPNALSSVIFTAFTTISGAGGNGGVLYGGGGCGGSNIVYFLSDDTSSDPVVPSGYTMTRGKGGKGGRYGGDGGLGALKFYANKNGTATVSRWFVNNPAKAGGLSEDAAVTPEVFPYMYFNRYQMKGWSSNDITGIATGGFGYGSPGGHGATGSTVSNETGGGGGGFCCAPYQQSVTSAFHKQATCFGFVDMKNRLSRPNMHYFSSLGYAGYYGNGGEGVSPKFYPSSTEKGNPGLPGVVAFWYYTTD